MNNKTYTATQIQALSDLLNIVPEANFRVQLYSPQSCVQKGYVIVDEDGCAIGATPTQDQIFSIPNFAGTFYETFVEVMVRTDTDLLVDQIGYYIDAFSGFPTHIPANVIDDKLPAAKQIRIIRSLPDHEITKAVDDAFRTIKAPNLAARRALEALFEITTISADEAASAEIRIQLHDLRGTVPTEPTETLRYIIFKTTGYPLLIKSKDAIEDIKRAASPKTREYFAAADLAALSSIFLRFKPLFLAFKAHPGCSPLINKLRRLAEDNHKPLRFNVIRNLTQIQDQDIQNALITKATNLELIRILNHLEAKGPGSTKPLVVPVRNGKTYVKDGGVAPATIEDFSLRSRIREELAYRLTPHLSGRTFYIPKGVEYAAPVSEKQFLGNLPFGTALFGDSKSFVFGIHWFDEEDGDGVDLDLHLQSAAGRAFGWCYDKKDSGLGIIYSGDLVTAPHPTGAAEAFHISAEARDEILIPYISTYNGPSEHPFSLFIAEADENISGSKSVCDPSRFLAPQISALLPNGTKTLGLIHQGLFYIFVGQVSDSRLPRETQQMYFEGLLNKLQYQVSLKEIILNCGGTIVDELPEDPTGIEDLSPAALDGRALLDLVEPLRGSK